MTITLLFQQDYTYPPSHQFILVPVRFYGGPAPFAIQAILDTGAVISVFDSAYTPQLGMPNYKNGIPTQLTLASGSIATGYIHNVRLELWRQALVAPIAFCPDWPNLIGMRGF